MMRSRTRYSRSLDRFRARSSDRTWARVIALGWLAGLVTAAGCGVNRAPAEAVYGSTHALAAGGALSAANLALQVSKNSCASNVAQDYLQVKNNDAVSVSLSDITIKYWINDTSGPAVVPHVWYGGCVTSANGTCVHTVSNVTATPVAFSACGPDATHQANWEITVSTTDHTALSPGFTWSGVQTAVNLANFANFSPWLRHVVQRLWHGSALRGRRALRGVREGEPGVLERHRGAFVPGPTGHAADRQLHAAPGLAGRRRAGAGHDPLAGGRVAHAAILRLAGADRCGVRPQ